MTMTMTRNQRTRDQTRMNRGTKNQKNRVNQNRNQMSDQKIEPTDEAAVGAQRSQYK